MAKTLLEQYDEWKQKKQKEEQQASQPKYTIPDSGSILEQYQSYKQQRQANEQKALSSKRINNPSHLGNVMIAGAVQNTQKKQAEAGRVAKEEEARRVKQEEKQSWNDYVQRLTDQYMPVRPDPIPQVDTNKKYGPVSELTKRGATIASSSVSDAPFGFGKIIDLSGNGGSMSVRNSAMEEADRERQEREERDRADREAYQAALERANLGRGGEPGAPMGGGKATKGWTLDDALGQDNYNSALTEADRERAEQEARDRAYTKDREALQLRLAEKESQQAAGGRGGRIVSDKVALEGALETADRERAEFAQRDMQGTKEREAVLERNLTVEDLQAKRAAAEKDIEQYNKVLEWVPSPQNVEAYQNYLSAQTQKKAAQEGIEQIDTFTLIKQLKDQASKETDPFELADINSKLQAAEYKYEWSTMDPEERAKTWVWQRVERGFRNYNRAYYGLTTDLIADILGIDRSEVSKQNQKQLDVINKEIAYQAQSASAIEGAAGDILTMAVENLPNIVLSFLGGGGLSVAANAAMDLKTAAAPFVTKFLNSFTKMVKNPMWWNSFMRSAGSNYIDEHDIKGNDPIISLTAASIKGFLDSTIEVGGGIETGEFKPLGFGSMLRSGGEEMGEEFFQGPVSNAYDFSQSGKGADTKLEDIVSWDNPNAIISGKQMAQEGIMGFAGGAALSGMQQAGVAAVGAVKGQDLSAEPRSEYNYPEANIDQQIASKEAEIAKKESEAYENAARERMDFETRDGEAAKKYSELVTLVNESFPEESETRAKIAEATTIDTKRMTEIATGAMQELRARMQAEPTPETLKLSEALTQTVEGIFAGMQTDRNAITDKYTAGLDEGLKAEIKGKNDADYAKGYGIAHALGQMGVPVDTIAKVKSVSTLQETAQEAAQQGQAKWEAALPQLKAKAADLQKALPKPGQGGVTYRANVKQEALSTLQRDQIGLLEKIAKPLGYNFVMMEFDKDAQGNYVTDKGQIAPNGFFRDSDGTIYIDVNAGKTVGRMVEDTIIPLTAGHELGHYLKATSPELFRAYSAAVVEELVSKGTDIDALIAKQIGRGKLREITVESAIEEMIMESGAMILSNSQAAQKMAETNPGLFQKIAEWVKDFVDSIRKAFSRVDATPEAKAIMQTVNGALKYSDTIINLWDTMAVTEAKERADVKPATVARRDVQAVAKEAATKKTAYTSDGQAVDYHYEIAPVGSLIPSNLETSLEPNPDYPQELQPRDRTRAASQQQVEEIANKLNPALLGESADVGTGAPFVGPDMVVESGNGRILAITRAMRQGKGLTYTQWLKDNAARFGIDPAKVDNASVLVRVRDTEVNRPEFVQKANESQVATYSDSESAVSDAKKVTLAMLEMANMDSGDINSAGNSSFVSSFISKVVPVAERGRMMDASGKLSKSGENRVRTALFQMAYEDGYLTEQMAEASDDTSKNILKAMTAVAPRLALMNDAMKKGTLGDYPIGQAIAEAYRIVQRQKRLGVSVDRYINQQSLVRQDTPAHWMLLEMFNENRKAPNRMADALNSILNAAERQGNPNQMLMPGLEAERPSVEGIVRDGLNRYADEGMAASERYQERDTQYLAAVESGDMATAQKMVDEAAREAGYEVGPVYHGTNAKFNTFRRGDIGFHFGTKSQARTRSGYGRNAVVISANLNMQNPLRVSNDYGSWDADYAAKWMLEDGHITQGEYREIMNTPSSKQNKAMRELLIRKGYDGVEYVNQFEGRSPKPSYIVFLSSQAKRTDPVTYDDSGNVIPLSQRFTDSNDIRFQERDSDNAPLSPEQIEYFKDSKVRDEQGRLLKVYHGTTRGFTEFRTNAPGQTIKDTIGSHFGTEKAANDRLGVVGKEKSPYGENVPSVMDVFLNITNPLLKRDGSAMTESELNAYLKRVGKKLNIPDRELGSSSQFSRVPSYVGETIQAYLKEQGYDGIPYINSWEDRGNVSYIAFSPEQIKSTTNLTPTSSPDIRYQERDPVPAMYSKMAQEIEAYKGDKLGADSVVKYLQGRGVKADEIRWSGIVPFLQGKKSVSKAELLDFAKASALRVEDITYEDQNYEFSEEELEVGLNEGADERKFKDYTLKDGDNYRELLFTAPDLPGTFQSAHFDEKNVLAHTRLQDFQTTDGKPVLFVEEVQSDWHEKGREEGYKEYDNKELDAQIKAAQAAAHEASYKYRNAAEALQNKRNALNAQYQGRSIPSSLWDEFVAERNKVNALMEQSDKSSKAAMELMDKRDKLVAADYNKVSPAPFAATWHEYVLKRVLRMAAEGGYDYVGWTTGQMQADRYNLSKQVGSIEPERTTDGILINVYKHTGVVISELSRVYAPDELVGTFGKDLSRRIIEVADAEEILTDDDLIVGGEGMKAFYDIGGKSSQNIPRFLNKYGAQWGAKISTIDMQGSENTYQVPAIEVTDAMKESVLYEGQPLYQERVMTTPRGVEVIQNATGEELSQMRKEFMERTGLPRSVADVRTTYDEQGNDYTWIAYEGMHASVEPYINKRFNTRTHQQWEWWKRPDKDEYPTDYSYIRIDDRFQERDSVPKPKLSSKQITEILQEIDAARPRDVKQSNYLKNGIISRLREKGITHIDAYHVTDASEASLQDKGILGSELDYVGRTSGNLRESSVYVFLDPDDIELGYGGITGISESTNNVVHLLIPINKITDMYPDYNFGVSFDTYSSVRFVGDMPSNYIDGVYKINKPAKDIRYQERDPDYRTKRDILAGAFDSVAQTEGEKRNLKEYKNLIGSLNRMEEEARGLRQANTAEWKKAEPDRAKVNENKKRIFEIEKRIFSMDKKLIQMQNAAPLRNVLIRQKREFERTAVDKYKGKRDTNELNDALDLRADRAAKRLMKYALTPDKNSHVPDGMRTDITNLLTALDLASEDKAGNARDSYRARSWQEALTALGIRMKNADMVAATTKGNDEVGPALLVDPALQDKIESLIKRNDGVVRYRNLKTKEKQTVVEILESVSVAVSEANKKFSADRTKTISDVADKTIDYAKAQREKKLRGEIAERLSTFLNIDMADAFTFFDSLGEGGQEILKGLYNEGFSKLVRNTEEARAFFDGLNAKYGKYGMSTWGGKNATPKNFKVASGTLTMTPAQVMELYMLNKREQARGHIYGQGIRVERIRSRKPGKAAVLWQKDALTVTPAEIEAITSTLTEQQKQVAEEFGAFFGRTSTKWGNEVSMTLYGYYKFIEQNYYPIHSDTNFTMTQDPNSADMLYALLNIGATKDTVKFANNPIIISDIFDTVTRHITDMANYNAFAPALVDAMKWFNYKRIVKDEAGNMRLESVKGGIERMMGAAGKNYVINLLKAVNGIKNPQVASGFAGMVNSAIGKFKTSAVGANARVVLQQHASYVRGSALLSPASMAAAYFRSPRRGMQMARKYSAIAAWKHMGYFDMNIGRQMSDLINGNESTAEKIRQAAMKPAGLADDFTIGVLWNAAEIELGKTYKGDKRSEEFYKLVGEKLTEVIDRTQVVDTVFHRSQIMRDKDGLTKIATNFMSEPIKTYNLLMSAVKTGDLKTIARTGTVALLSYVVVAMAAGFSDAARDKDKEKGWQGYWESWMKNVLGIGGNFFESNVWDNINPLSMIPFGKEVYGLAAGYPASRPDLQAAQRMIWAANDWMDLFKGEDKDLYKLIYNTANAISTASGIPISNVMRDVKALYDTLDPRVVVGDNTKVVYQRFADALANGEEDKALAYYNALIDSGRDSVTIRTQAMQRYKDEETVIAAAEAKKAGDFAAYEKAIDQAVKDGIPRDMAIKAADGLSTEKAEKVKPERAKTIDEVKKAMDYKDTYTYESNDLMVVIEKGDNVAAKKIIDKMLKEGRKKDAISGNISTYFKPIYLEAYKKGRASNLKANLLTMYSLLGYDRAKKSKDIDAWLKQ